MCSRLVFTAGLGQWVGDGNTGPVSWSVTKRVWAALSGQCSQAVARAHARAVKEEEAQSEMCNRVEVD